MLKLNQRGVTIVELMVGLLMTSLITAAGFAIYLRSHQTYLAQAEVNDLQYRGRDALTEIANHVQMAGHLLPASLSPFQAYNTNPDSIVIFAQLADPCQASLVHPMPQPSAELRCDGLDISCFVDNEWAYIYDPNTKTGEFFWITQVQYDSSHIQHNTMSLSKAYPAGSEVMKVEFVKYYIDGTDINHPALMVSVNGGTPTTYARDITDLQFIYTMADGSLTSVPINSRLVREVEITLNGITTKSDVDWNHLRRQRTYSTKAKVRNLDL